MREIKFRAWDHRLKKFAQHTFYVGSNGFTYKDSDPHGVDMSNGRRIFPTGDYGLMQYTGLKDKNGKEIWEGDILKSGVKPWVVKTIGACFMMIQQRPTRLIIAVERFIHEEVEIIGNIYENPELLGKPRPE